MKKEIIELCHHMNCKVKLKMPVEIECGFIHLLKDPYCKKHIGLYIKKEFIKEEHLCKEIK